MGCGPLLRCQTACTNVTANLRSKRPAFHTPSVAFGDTFPASRRRGRPAAACRLDDLCERRRAKGAASRPRRQPARNRSLAGLFKGLGAKNCNFRALALRPFGWKAPPRPDTRCCRFEASEAIPIPGAESIFSGLSAPFAGESQLSPGARRGRSDGMLRRARVPDLVGPGRPGPYHLRARNQSFQAFAAPFADQRVLPSGVRLPRSRRQERRGSRCLRPAFPTWPSSNARDVARGMARRQRRRWAERFCPNQTNGIPSWARYRRVEEGRGGLSLWQSPRFPSPLIKPDVPD